MSSGIVLQKVRLFGGVMHARSLPVSQSVLIRCGAVEQRRILVTLCTVYIL